MLACQKSDFLDVSALPIEIGGRHAGLAVSLGSAMLFFTPYPELKGLDGRRFASRQALVGEVADCWRRAAGRLARASRLRPLEGRLWRERRALDLRRRLPSAGTRAGAEAEFGAFAAGCFAAPAVPAGSVPFRAVGAGGEPAAPREPGASDEPARPNEEAAGSPRGRAVGF